MRERSVCMCVVLNEKEKEKKNKNESAGQIEKRENCEICGGGGWVRWGTCGPKNQTSFFFFSPIGLGYYTLSHRALSQGYWWPNLQREA